MISGRSSMCSRLPSSSRDASRGSGSRSMRSKRAAEARLQPVDQLPARRLAVGPQHADHQQRLEHRQRRDLGDQLQRRRVRPVKVVEHDNMRPRSVVGDGCAALITLTTAAATPLTIASPAQIGERDAALLGVDREHGLVGTAMLLAATPSRAIQAVELLAHHLRGVPVGAADDLPAELPPGIVGDRLAVGDRPRLEPFGPAPRAWRRAALRSSAMQARLAEPGLADHRHDGAHARAERVEPLAQQRRSRVSRPTSGEVSPSRPRGFPAWPCAPTTSNTSTVACLPFTSMAPRGTKSNSAWTSRWVSALISTVAGLAPPTAGARRYWPRRPSPCTRS